MGWLPGWTKLIGLRLDPNESTGVRSVKFLVASESAQAAAVFWRKIPSENTPTFDFCK